MHRQDDSFKGLGRWRRGSVGLLGGALLSLPWLGTPHLHAAGEAAPPREPEALVWPAPPSEPRVAYVRSIRGPADMGWKASRWRRFLNLLTGRQPRDEEFIRPFGVALDEMDNLCVVDGGAAAVACFDGMQHVYRRWDTIGRIRLIAPVAVAKAAGTFFVADSGLRKVLAFDAKGALLCEIGQNLRRPTAVAIRGERLYVADAEAHCIAVFDLQGKFLSSFGEHGSEPGKFNFPTHLAIGPDGQILVTDSMNARVQVFNEDGRFLSVIGSAGDSSGHFGRPKGVAVDRFGHVYVVDALFDNVQVFDLEGRFLMAFGSAGSEAGEFWMPAGIAVGRDQSIFVADAYNRRVQVFTYMEKP